jgi:hypothetical protein
LIGLSKTGVFIEKDGILRTERGKPYSIPGIKGMSHGNAAGSSSVFNAGVNLAKVFKIIMQVCPFNNMLSSFFFIIFF